MKVAIVGASGYVGAELVGLILQHDKLTLSHLLVSQNSESSGKKFSELHPKFVGVCDQLLEEFSEQWLATSTNNLDAVFFATPHEYSATWAKTFLNKGIKVFDLSGGFRLKDTSNYPTFYDFEHQDLTSLNQAVYGLAEWQEEKIKSANLVAVPGCYPTASLLSLKPVTSLGYQVKDSLIVVNGISGVSGAGRKASLATSYNEVSLTPYNILQHRHQPEISQEANASVIFNPHLAPYKRGLLATVTLQLESSVTTLQVDDAFLSAYQGSALVRLINTWPKIDNVANTPFADVHWKYDEERHVLVVSCAIDNLLKGAASQAIQCANITMGLKSHYSLIAGAANDS